MEFLTQKELQKMMLYSYEKIEAEKEEINKINVFPVPDQDTGSNLAKTLMGVKEAIEGKEFKDLTEISKAALDGALNTAQGNAGVIYTGFLAGFLPSLQNKNPIDCQKLAKAFREGAKRARRSIQNPKEGTILDVIDATAEAFEVEIKKENDILKVLKKAIKEANEALLATREKMEVFKKANVVDAGGLGFLLILESYLEALEGEKEKGKKKEEKPSEKTKRFIQTISTRYEVVSLISDSKFTEPELREKLKDLGNSLDIVQIGRKTKIHIHTDFLDEVKDVIRQSGKIEALRVEDMAKEVAGEESIRRVSIGIVTDSVAGLLPKITERYQIEVVPTVVEWPGAEKIPGENIYQKMREGERLGIKTFPKTSQATPKSYFEAFQKQLQKFDKVLCITVTSKLSGCYNSAQQAKEMLKESHRVFIFDSLQALGAQALLVLKAIELIQEQREIGEVLERLKRFYPKVHLYALFKDPRWLEAGGRINKRQANWIRRIQKIRLHPLMTVKKGVIKKAGVIFAKDMPEALFKKIKKESEKIRKKGKKIRVIINHADNLEDAEKLKKLLKEIKAEVSFIALTNPVVGAHIGPDTLIASWAPIEI